MQRYLRPSLLAQAGLQTFDDWASTFGEVVSKAEMKPAGNGYRTKKRFAKFNNLPELMAIVHQIRNSCKFVPYKDRKTVCADLKKIYGAVNLDEAEFAKEEFREKWDKKYPNILKSWDKNWAELTVFFEYPQEIRKIIYTTNAVEGYHRMVRKFTKSKSIFPTDDAIRKVIYMSVTEISKKWTMPVRDWGLAYAQFSIYFDDRFAA